MSEYPDFASFYHAANGRRPFPWQERLARQVANSEWPSQIGIPTGLGKTACLDIALWVLAAQAALAPAERTAPTRIWYVVNRRLLVDQAFSHGRALAEMTATGMDSTGRHSDAIGSVAAALRSLASLDSAGGPLQVTRLRGGAELGERPLDPSQPAILFATVAMFASRWLFRGYGTSRSMRPVDAALAGIDTLVLLDEAHLSRPLVDLARRIEQCDIGDPSRVIAPARSRPVMVSLTATGQPADELFALDAADLGNSTVSRRMQAHKPVALSQTKERSLAKHLTASVEDLLEARSQSSTCIVFVNTPKLARSVVAELELLLRRGKRAADVVMATGRMREREAEAVRQRLLDPIGGARAGHDPSIPRKRDLIVVATQTLEVGADLDFDLLVTETCGVRALIQRLGRLNRLGETPDAAGVIADVSDRDKCPVYGDEPGRVWEDLTRCSHDGQLDLSPSRIPAVLLTPPKDQPPRVGELLHAHLWEWAKTSCAPAGEAPVELFFEGFDDRSGRVSVCWRACIPNDGVRLVPGIRESEAMEVPIWELRQALEGRDAPSASRLADDRASLETVTLDALRPGDEIVLPTSIGLCDENGWNPAASQDVLDVALLSSGLLPLAEPAVRNLAYGSDVCAVLSTLIDPGESGLAAAEERRLVGDLLESLRLGPHHPWLTDQEWVEFLEALSDEVERPVDDVPLLRRRPADHQRSDLRAEVFEEMSFDVAARTLAAHHEAVGCIASRIADRVGIDPVPACTIRTAAQIHDIGKADPRFQRWLGANFERGVLVAKSATPRHLMEAERQRAGWPKGGRHELLSARALMRAPFFVDGDVPWDRDLLLHLVAAHHGHGRPLVPPVADTAFVPFTVLLDGVETQVGDGLASADWSQPGRFRGLCERYGYWGLALMEAIVRQADHAASRAGGVV